MPENVQPTGEGECQFCHRDIGGGHDVGCPYWQPKPEAARVHEAAKRGFDRPTPQVELRYDPARVKESED